MISKLAESAGEVALQAAVFIIAFFLSTGLTCGGKPLCENHRDSQAEVVAP